MKTISLKKRLIALTKAVSIMFLLIAVQAQDIFPPNDFPMVPDAPEGPILHLDTESHPETLLPTSETYIKCYISETNVVCNCYHSDGSVECYRTTLPSPLDTSSEPDDEHLLVKALRPPKVPSSPKSPLNSPENTCQTKCAGNCLVKKGSILGNLCNKICKQKCLLSYSYHSIYICTHHCARLMLHGSKSDKKKAASYVEDCYKKCSRKS